MSATTSTVSSAIAQLDITGIAPKILNIVNAIKTQYDQMGKNQELCKDLNDQVMLIGEIVQVLIQKKQTRYCEKTLEKLQESLIQCNKLIQSLTPKNDTIEKFKTFLQASKHQSVIEKLTNQLKALSGILNLALNTGTAESIEKIEALIREKEIEKTPAIQAEHQEIEQVLQGFLQAINEGNTDVHAQAGRDVTLVAGGIRAQETVALGGGEFSSSTQSKAVRTVDLNAEAVLKKLKILFMSEEHLSEKQSSELESYNQALDPHKATLVYVRTKQVHQLYLNDDPLEPRAAIKAITRMIESIAIVATTAPISGDSSINRAEPIRRNQGNANISTQSGRDSNLIAGGVQAASVRIGGGDYTFTPTYNQIQNNNNLDGLHNNLGNVQVGDKSVQHNVQKP